MNKEPLFFMMVGLPYSGKSERAKQLRREHDAVIHSSDDIRAEILGDVQDQANNAKVFEVLHERVKRDLLAGKNVIYDATNINHKRRKAFLDELKNIPCAKVCEFMATPYKVCYSRSQHRARVVPWEVFDRMYRNIWVPYFYEGWDCIQLVYPDEFEPYDANDLFNGENGLNRMEHDNPHHTFSVGHHCLAAYGLVRNGSNELQEAALLHDIGKPYTKTFTNSKGEVTEVAHYYDHHNVSAYDSLFYSDPKYDRLYIANLIQWHMRPFEIKKSQNPTRTAAKFEKLIGADMYKDVMALHVADLKAH